MPKYSVDLKMFVRIEVEAMNADLAEQEAQAFAEGAWGNPEAGFLQGWQSERPATGPRVLSVGSLDTADGGYIEDEDGNEIDEDERQVCSTCWDLRCDGCTPPDSPSLDTAAHDREMEA